METSRTLAEFLRQLRQRHSLIAAHRLVPGDPFQLRRQVAILTATLGAAGVIQPGQDELQWVQAQVMQAWRANIDLATLPPRSLRIAPWVLWRPDFAPAAETSFVRAFTRAGEERVGGRFVEILGHTFLLYYPHALSTFEEWRKTILNLILHHASDHRRLQETWYKWQKHNILSRDGPKLLAQQLARAPNAENLFHQAGLEHGLSDSKFVEVALKTVLNELQNALAADDVPTQRLELLPLFTHDGRLRFPSLKSQLAHALLLPFWERDPREEIRQRLTEFLKGLFGDPRLSRQQWHGISEQAQAVMRRWLARVSLEDFFRVIDATADPSHWHARKAFWMRYWERGLISDAWVALGRTARLHLSEDSAGGYATLEGALPNHAALLLRIGRAVVLEWSHSGACRIFPVDARGKPALYRNYYFAKELRAGTPYWVRHAGDRWQREIAKYLHEVAGVPDLAAAAAPYRRPARWS